MRALLDVNVLIALLDQNQWSLTLMALKRS